MTWDEIKERYGYIRSGNFTMEEEKLWKAQNIVVGETEENKGKLDNKTRRIKRK